MKKITLNDFFEFLRGLDGSKPNGSIDIDEKDEAIQIRIWGEYAPRCVILDGYSNADFEKLYNDIVKMAEEQNWTYITCLQYPGCFPDSYFGKSLIIIIEGKSVFITINNNELAEKINP